MQSVTTTIAMDAKGNLTIPDAIRATLGIDGARLWEAEVVDQTLILRLDAAIPEDDLWAYTPEHIARVKRALAEGGGRQMSEAELLRLIGG